MDKNLLNLKILEKGQMFACDNCAQWTDRIGPACNAMVCPNIPINVSVSGW